MPEVVFLQFFAAQVDIGEGGFATGAGSADDQFFKGHDLFFELDVEDRLAGTFPDGGFAENAFIPHIRNAHGIGPGRQSVDLIHAVLVGRITGFRFDDPYVGAYQRLSGPVGYLSGQYPLRR